MIPATAVMKTISVILEVTGVPEPTHHLEFGTLVFVIESSAYCPAGFVNGEDGCRNVMNGSWREEYPSTLLTPLRSISGNRQVYLHVNADQITSILL